MNRQDSHPSDQELVRAIDGELSAREQHRVDQHLAACWTCRARKQEFDGAIGEFIRAYQKDASRPLPPPEGPRALLKAHLAQLAETPVTPWARWFGGTSRRTLAAAACALAALTVGIFFGTASFQGTYARAIAFAVPNPNLTPGAAVLASGKEVCREPNTKNKEVPVALRRRVFEAYGIPRAEPGAYEVDYLITPALGGADDVRNLWPQSHSNTVWNAEVKDALEDHLREMVCDGEIDLPTAQKEIATNWIAAYKKYFHTESPLEP